MAIRFVSSFSINGLDEMLGLKSLPLSRVCLIEDGALRFFHVVREEETYCNACRLICIGPFGCVHMSMGVHRALLISAVIIAQMKG